MATMLRSISTTPSAWAKPVSTALMRSIATTHAALASDESKQLTHVVKDPIEVESISGAPEELVDRTVRIFSPSKPATQSGKFGTRHWRIDFDVLPEGNRWENPLIGWASSADYEQALAIKFNSKEAAIHFAEKQGWSYYVQEPKNIKFVKKSYADNFKYVPGKLRLIKTK